MNAACTFPGGGALNVVLKQLDNWLDPASVTTLTDRTSFMPRTVPICNPVAAGIYDKCVNGDLRSDVQ